MEKNITFRFYRIKRHSSHVPRFVDVLSKIAEIKKKSDREHEIYPDFDVRLEEFEHDGPDAIIGEIIRVQNTNMPSEVLEDGRCPLSTPNPLGHGITFRFNSETSVLCIQYDPRIVSPGKLLDYMAACFNDAVYDIKPMLKPEAWKKFNKSEVKQIAIKIADPIDLGSVDPEHSAARDGFRAMGEVYESPNVKIELSMGHHKGYLSEKVKGLAKSLVHSMESKSDGSSLVTLRAVTYIDDARDDIDLIEDRLKVKEILPLDDRDPQKNYKIKKIYIKKIMIEQGV